MALGQDRGFLVAEEGVAQGRNPVSLSLPLPKHCVTLLSCLHCRSSLQQVPGKFLALGPRCCSQPVLLVVASP